MNTHISIPIPTTTFLLLVDFLREQGSNRDPVEQVTEAVHYWIDNASWKQEDLMPETFESSHQGFTWKYRDTSLFLPDGTEIRMRYKEQYHYAKVVGDEITYQGQSLSPGALATVISGSSRNAWRDLWIKRPKDSDWILADDCRRNQGKLADLLKLLKAPESKNS